MTYNVSSGTLSLYTTTTQERSRLPVHKPGINSYDEEDFQHLNDEDEFEGFDKEQTPFVTQTVLQLSSVISKLYYLRRRTV